jgi:hypothetical protein
MKGAVMDVEGSPSRLEVVDEVSKWSVGGGILLTALAPLALPIVILTIVALLPLAVPVLALGLVAGVVAAPVMLVRKVGRALSHPRPPRPEAPAKREPAPRVAGQV